MANAVVIAAGPLKGSRLAPQEFFNTCLGVQGFDWRMQAHKPGRI